MSEFDKCRVCLETISHEPIKMTRSILNFIDIALNLKFVARQFEPKSVKLNLCAVCFNKLSDFQDFFEMCKESDEFWAGQFASDKQKQFEECLPDIEEECQHVEDGAATAERETYLDFKETDDFIQIEPPEAVVDDDCTHNVSDMVEDIADEEPEPDVNDSIVQYADLNQWSANNVNDNVMAQDSNNHSQHDTDQELIEFEHELRVFNHQVDNHDSSQAEVPSSTVAEAECQTVNIICEFDDIDETESCDTLIQEAFDDVLSETTQEQFDSDFVENTVFQSRTIAENGKVKKSYQCGECDRTFDRIYDIESHYNIHSDIKPYVCDVCGRSFRQKNILTTHQALHFGKKIECPECDKKFARRSQLILHFRMHRDEKPFICDFEGCDAAFRQRQHLVDHLFIHTGEKNFQCGTCTKSFHTRKRLQDHMYKVHSSHRYRCDMCDKAFLKPHMLKNHLLNIHNCEVNDVSHLKVSVEQLKPSKKT